MLALYWKRHHQLWNLWLILSFICLSGDPATSQSICKANEVCLPIAQCSAQLDSEEEKVEFCSPGIVGVGVCCEEITSFESDVVLLEKPNVTRRSIRSVSEGELKIALEQSNSLVSNATLGMAQLNATNTSNWSAFSQQAHPGVIQLGKNCLVAMETARQLANLSNREFFFCEVSLQLKSNF